MIITSPLSRIFGVAAALLLLAGCDDSSLAPGRILGVSQSAVRQSLALESPAAALAGNAAEQRQKALTGRKLRGEQDEMLRYEAELPGFGGLYVDANDHVVIYLKPSAGTDANHGRGVLARHFAARQQPFVRNLAAAVAQARVKAAEFTLSELVAYERTIADPPVPIPGYVGVGVLVQKNRVEVSFETQNQMTEGLKIIEAMGIPSNAIIAEATGPLIATTTWNDFVRPSRGGVALTLFNSSFSSSQYGFTHGFNVRIWSDQTKFLTVSHAPNIVYGTNGMTGATVYQPNIGSAALGSIGLNPAWNTQDCGVTPSGIPIDFCTTSDAALGDFATGSGERKIGISMYGGFNGGAGTATINNFYPIYGATDPDYVVAEGANRIFKSGARTGSTFGDLGRTCFDAFMQIGWGNVSTTRWLRVYCAAEILHAGWGAGDSGAPVTVSTLSTNRYTALGMEFAGLGLQYPNGSPSSGICSAGTACRVIFSKWSSMEARLGAMDPSTVAPPL